MTSDTDDIIVETSMVSTTQYAQVSVSQWLAVGASQPPDSSALYVNGNMRVDGTITAETLAFEVDGLPSIAEIVAEGETAGQLGLTGVLRVQDALGVGTNATDDLSTMGELVVRAAPDASVPLQIWQSANAQPLVVVDSQGRLGVGADTLNSNLTVQGAYLQALTGTVSGATNLHTVTGNGTSFTTEVRVGDWISIPAAGATPGAPTLYLVAAIKSDTDLQVTAPLESTFKDVPAFQDESLLVNVLNAAGSSQLSIGRWGDVMVAGNMAVAGALTASGSASLGSALDVAGLATLAGGLAVGGAASLGRTLNVTGETTLTGALTTNGSASFGGSVSVAGTTSLSALSVTGSTSLAALTVSGPAGFYGTLGVFGTTSLGDLSVTFTTSLSDLSVSGSATLSGVAVTGPASFAALSATGDATLGNTSITGDMAVSGTTALNSLTATGSTTLGDVASTGSATLNEVSVSGSTALADVSVSGNTSLNTVSVGASATVGGSLSVSGSTVMASLSASGDAAFSSNVILGANVQMNRTNTIGTNPTDVFQYQGQTIGNYTLGWFDDPWDPYGGTAWLSAWSGIKLLTNESLAFSVSRSADVAIGGNATIENNSVSGGLGVAAAPESLRLIRGNVHVNGSSISSLDGAGFTVTRLDTGQYRVDFSTPFPSLPSVSVTQVFPNFGNPQPHGDSMDNAVIYGLTNASVWILTGDSAGHGNASDRSFSFVVLGPRS